LCLGTTEVNIVRVFEKGVLRKNGKIKFINSRSMNKMTQQETSYLFVWVAERGVWGLLRWLQGHQHRRAHAHVPLCMLLTEKQTRIVVKYGSLK
jgi:hypothetical protein